MDTSVSSTKLLNSYNFLNANNIKNYIINQLQQSDNPTFKGIDYLGSNMNAFIDVVSTVLQQTLFHLSLVSSESSFATATLFESMNKIVSLLNYKVIGKQTSMLPIRYTIDLTDVDDDNISQIIIPKFISINYNTTFIQREEIVKEYDSNVKQIQIDSILYEGNLTESSIYTANGDEFELITLNDNWINSSSKFITDNFFSVYVDENDDGNWVEYTETSSLFLESGSSRKYEKRFNENYNYEFKFGNDITGKKLLKNSRIVIFYVLSNGENAIVGDGVIDNLKPSKYTSKLYEEIKNNYKSYTDTLDVTEYMTVKNVGPSTNISYPEDVESMRVNAPKSFSSQNRLLTLSDFKNYIDKNFAQYCKSTYLMDNDEYTSNYLKYFYDIGLDSPQEDNRILLSQVNFQTACNFNNVYCVILPKVNTIINGTTPNYLNNSLKQQMVESVKPYKGLAHNFVPMDPIYKAITFGCYKINTQSFNQNQLLNKLILVRDSLSKYSYTYIKNYCISIFKDYFNNLSMGDPVDLSELTKQLLSIPGVEKFYIKTNDGLYTENKLTFFVWNPLYKDTDNTLTQQLIVTESFTYCYFYDLDNIGNLIVVEDE